MAVDLAAHLDLPFPDLLRRYWAQSDLPGRLTKRHITGDVTAGARADEVANTIERLVGSVPDENALVLEVGCGTAALGAAFCGRVGWVVVSDLSLAWLVLARRRLLDGPHPNVSMLASAAHRLPFATGTFDLVVAADVIEHVPNPAELTGESIRVARVGGSLWLSTPNRFSPTPEPHVRVWGVGFLPRGWAGAYVRLVRGVPYDGIKTLSLGDLRRLAERGTASFEITLPQVPDAMLPHYSTPARALIRAYHFFQRISLLRPLIMLVTPFFHVVLTKRGDVR